MKPLPETSFAEIAVMLREVANHHADNNGPLEVLAHKLSIAGLNEELARRLIADARHRAELLGHAHVLMKAMCEHEAEIRRLIAPPAIVRGEVA